MTMEELQDRIEQLQGASQSTGKTPPKRLAKRKTKTSAKKVDEIVESDADDPSVDGTGAKSTICIRSNHRPLVDGGKKCAPIHPS